MTEDDMIWTKKKLITIKKKCFFKGESLENIPGYTKKIIIVMRIV